MAAGEDRARTAKVGALETFDNLSKLWTLVKGLDQTVCSERVDVVGSSMQRLKASVRLLLRSCRRAKAVNQYAMFVTASRSSVL